MDARPLIVMLTAFTVSAWGLCALIAAQAAPLPLLGLLPLPAWPFALSATWPLILVALVYCCLLVLAWRRESKLLAWAIPTSPLIGALSFAIQFGIGMSAFK